MKADIVFPKNNEEEFISIALKLGYKEICFCYSLSNFKKYKSDKIKIFYAIQLEKLEQLSMAKKKTDCVIVKNPSRKFFEKKINMVYDLELSELNDSLHYRESGLNQVLCKLASLKDITIVYNFGSLLDEKRRITKIGRMIQNIKLANKYKLKQYFASFATMPKNMRSYNDLKAFFRVLGL